jgi:hypothetical protein
MNLIQIFLPVEAAQGETAFEQTRKTLADRFGGVTAYAQSPAEGLWRDESKKIVKDKIVVLEVMVNRVDHAWWKEFQRELKVRFAQKEILMRAIQVERL